MATIAIPVPEIADFTALPWWGQLLLGGAVWYPVAGLAIRGMDYFCLEEDERRARTNRDILWMWLLSPVVIPLFLAAILGIAAWLLGLKQMSGAALFAASGGLIRPRPKDAQ